MSRNSQQRRIVEYEPVEIGPAGRHEVMREVPDSVISILTYDLLRRQKGINDDLIVLDENSNDVFRDPITRGAILFEEAPGNYGILRDTTVERERPDLVGPFRFSMNKVRERLTRYEENISLLTFENYVIAGGAVSDAITDNSIKDIDFFFYGLSAEQLSVKVNEIILALFSKKADAKTSFTQIRTPHVYTIKYCYDIPTVPRRSRWQRSQDESRVVKTFQFILRAYRTLSEILHSFDIPAGAVAYSGHGVHMTTMAYFSLKNFLIILDTTRRSTTYEVRLTNYMEKGFSVLTPFNLENNNEADRWLITLAEIKQNQRLENLNEYNTSTGMFKIRIRKGEIVEPFKVHFITKIVEPVDYPNPIHLLFAEQLYIRIDAPPGASVLLQNWRDPLRMLNRCVIIDSQGDDWKGQIATDYSRGLLRYISGVGHLYSAQRTNGQVNAPIVDLRKLLRTNDIDASAQILADFGEGRNIVDAEEYLIRRVRPRRPDEIVEDPNEDFSRIDNIYSMGVICTLHPRRLRKILQSEPRMVRVCRNLLTALTAPTQRVERMEACGTDILKHRLSNGFSERSGWRILTDNPGSQITGSYNPIVKHPRDWYARYIGILEPDGNGRVSGWRLAREDEVEPEGQDQWPIKYNYDPRLRLVMFLSLRLSGLTSNNLAERAMASSLRMISHEDFRDNPLYYYVLNDISRDGTRFQPSRDYTELLNPF